MKKMLIVAVVIAVPLYVFLYPSYRLRKAFAEEQLRRFEVELTEGSHRLMASDTVPPRTGKVVVMLPTSCRRSGFVQPSTKLSPLDRQASREVDPPRLHSVMYELDASLRASGPDDAETVIFCERQARAVIGRTKGVETEGGSMWLEWDCGKRRVIVAKVYDVKSRRFLGCYEVQGPAPEKKGGKYEDYGPEPDMVAFIEAMPLSR